MSSTEVQQLGALSDLFEEAIALRRPASVAILGIAGGNGLGRISGQVSAAFSVWMSIRGTLTPSGSATRISPASIFTASICQLSMSDLNRSTWSTQRLFLSTPVSADVWRMLYLSPARAVPFRSCCKHPARGTRATSAVAASRPFAVWNLISLWWHRTPLASSWSNADSGWRTKRESRLAPARLCGWGYSIGAFWFESVALRIFKGLIPE